MIYNDTETWKIVMGPTFNAERVNPASYDLTLAEDALIGPATNTVLISTAERVALPSWLAGVIHPKSSRMREGLQIPTTPGWVDPGFEGNLTLAATYASVVQRSRPEFYGAMNPPGYVEREVLPPWQYGPGWVFLPAGAAIAQLVLHQVWMPAQYEGHYQNSAGVQVSAEGH